MIPKVGEVYMLDLGYQGKTRPVVIMSREDHEAPRALARLSLLDAKKHYFRLRRRRKCLVEKDGDGWRSLATDLPSSFVLPGRIKLPPKHVSQMSFTAQRWQGTSLLQHRRKSFLCRRRPG